MKTIIQKISKVTILFAAALTVIALGKADVKAAEQIQLNQTYTKTLKGNGRFDFTFTTPAKGYFRIETALIKVVNENGKEISGNYTDSKLVIDYKQYWKTTTFLGKGAYASPEFALEPGKTATYSISDQYDRYTYTYEFKVVNEVPANFETESNNLAKNADKLAKVKKVYSGVLNSVTSDVDWYVFKAPKTGKYKFEVVDTNTDNWGYFYAEGFKSKTKQDVKTMVQSSKGWTKVTTVKLKKGKKYYIKLSDSTGSVRPYQVRVKKVK
ncbi:hypothetical protein [Butyrivibrio sp. JL13D10]|uniref:hypothetical protein n=1 Tax=Butyrivibrio sp. JL13D10 TaxID=3236815 RepID=UPI0038B4C97A